MLFQDTSKFTSGKNIVFVTCKQNQVTRYGSDYSWLKLPTYFSCAWKVYTCTCADGVEDDLTLIRLHVHQFKLFFQWTTGLMLFSVHVVCLKWTQLNWYVPHINLIEFSQLFQLRCLHLASWNTVIIFRSCIYNYLSCPFVSSNLIAVLGLQNDLFFALASMNGVYKICLLHIAKWNETIKTSQTFWKSSFLSRFQVCA